MPQDEGEARKGMTRTGGDPSPNAAEPNDTPTTPATPEESHHVGLTREMDEETRRKIVDDPLGAMRRMPMDPE